MTSLDDSDSAEFLSPAPQLLSREAGIAIFVIATALFYCLAFFTAMLTESVVELLVMTICTLFARKIPPEVNLGIAVACASIRPLVVAWRKCHMKNDAAKHTRIYQAYFGGLVFLVYGSVFEVCHYANVEDISGLDYHGPMRITGHQPERYQKLRSCSEGSCTYRDAFQATFQVAFGAQWACPRDDQIQEDTASVWCTTNATFDSCSREICGRKGCNDYEVQKAEQDIVACLYAAVPNLVLLTDGTPAFNHSVAPWDDPAWPATTLYGDCSNCRAVMWNPKYYDRIMKYGRYGAALISIGVVVLTLAGLAWLYIKYWQPRSGSKQQQPSVQQGAI